MPLTKSMSKEKVIHDFVHSDNKMFKGDSKKKRIQRALAAYYRKHRNEETVTEQKVRDDNGKVKISAKKMKKMYQNQQQNHQGIPEEYHVVVNSNDEFYIVEARDLRLNEIMGRRGEFIMTKYRMYQHPDHVEVWKRGMDLKGYEKDSSHPNVETAKKHIKKATADEIKSYQKITGRKLKWSPGKINALE